ncbi:hypothetical protein RHSIM_Rhsim06G0045900 [Rhododendron simsii]|uniref:Uncharacterized protein n=1 Tax=Rhododendron simsii TaxID=118357 RepID=A0A834GUU0_RHOSS|nr:hypothetical protein RHSIM_Rhsim06G0045900 [Rhododendron simsii]
MNGLPVSIVVSVLVVAGVFGNGVDNGWRVVAGLLRMRNENLYVDVNMKKTPRKRTGDPDVIIIEDSSHKSEVVKSSSPSPRKKVSPMKQKGSQESKRKKQESEMVYERKRKRPNIVNEEVIDLNTPTKRVTRSAEALKKMERGNDSEEREDKGFKGKKGKQVSRSGSLKRKTKVNQKVFSSELEPYGEEEELYRCSQFPKHKDDVLAGQMKKAVEKSSDEEMNDEQDEVVTLQGIIRKLTEENLQKDRTISDLREENEEKNRTISELRMWITNHPQSPKPGFGFEGISAQFDKDHLEHENITLQTEIGGMLIDKDIAEEKLEVAADTIDDFLTHTVTQLYRVRIIY